MVLYKPIVKVVMLGLIGKIGQPHLVIALAQINFLMMELTYFVNHVTIPVKNVMDLGKYNVSTVI